MRYNFDARSPRKIVLLSHDIAYRPGGGRDEEKELISFLKLAKQVLRQLNLLTSSLILRTWNTKGGSITVLLTSCLTGLE